MQLYFLSASVPLTKTFTLLPSGDIEKSAYPLIKNFTSHVEQVETPEEFCDALRRHAAEGHCLLKGKLKRPLVDESRAGSTDPYELTEWSCFDLDDLKGFSSVEAFITAALPPAFHDVDYILQYSASAGITPGAGFRAHVFFMHEQTFRPEGAKLFVTDLNLSVPSLAEQLRLTASGLAMHYPVDRTVCQNDKLIYIAPPILVGNIQDTQGERITLVKKSRPKVDYGFDTLHKAGLIEEATREKVAELRAAVGLANKRAKFRALGGEQVLLNPDVAFVTGEKTGRGFIYLNINHGDSWGYYYPENNPRFLYNFKGEPVVVIADFLPTYWAQLQERMRDTGQGPRPFAFRHRDTDTLWNGVWDPINERIAGLAQTARGNLRDFFAQYNMDVPFPVEDWTFEFNPQSMVRIDFDRRYCNKWEPTEYMKLAETTDKIPRTIDRILHSVVGDDEEAYDHFVNWLACVYQTRDKTATAWVLHGVPGTGKGVLYNEVLVPIFGHRYCLLKQVQAVEDRFNADLEQCLIFALDEARIEDSASAKRTLNRIKNMITEPLQDIRAMRSNSYQSRNFTNFLFFSNDYDALAIAPDDRRFNVAPRQENKIEITADDIAEIRRELPLFAGFLSSYVVDMQRARTALNNEAKARMRDASQDALEQMCQAVLDGNLSYFMAYAEQSPSMSNLAAWSSYMSTLRRWLDMANQPYMVRRDEIMAAYMYLLAPSNQPGPHKFTRMLTHKNLIATQQRCPATQTQVRGYRTEWKVPDEEIAAWKLVLAQPTQKQPPTDVASLQTWTPSRSASG